MKVDTTTAWNFYRYCYAANNPYKSADPDGRVIDTIADIGFIGYSAYTLYKAPSWTNAAALGADVVGAAVPFATGLGAGVRAGAHAAEAGKTGEKTYQTYTKQSRDPSTHGTYTGRASGTGTPAENVARRDAGHHKNATHTAAVIDKSSTNPGAIRGREQQVMDANGGAASSGGVSGNAINGISPKNPRRDEYLMSANKEFGE